MAGTVPAKSAGKTGEPSRPHPFFSRRVKGFPGCVMGKDANMQTSSGIVPAQGEKLKHKSGGGKLRGGRLFKGDWLGWGSRPSRASISTGFPRSWGGKK